MTTLSQEVNEFYEDNDNKNKLLKYLIDKTISLRTIDWYLTEYSKKNNIEIYNLFLEECSKYGAPVSPYSKYAKNFDIFKRYERTIYEYVENNEVKNFVTTLGQLNIFRWIIKNNIIEDIEKNINIINNDMYTTMQIEKKNYDSSQHPIL
jgi:hypothetical protein